MSDALFSLTRDDLRKIAGDNPRIIKAFEKLFVKTEENESLVENDTSLAIAKSNQAIGQATRNESRAKGNSVLIWLSTT